MPLRAVSADQLPYQPAAPAQPAPDVDLSVYGVTPPSRTRGRLYQSIDVGAEMEDEWKALETADSADKEQVCVLNGDVVSGSVQFHCRKSK